jgi:hypothetical protein
VQIIDLGEIDSQQSAAQKIRLFLVVAFEADPVTWPDHGFQQARGVVRRHDLAKRKSGAGRNARIACGAVVLPARHALCSFAALAPLHSDSGLARRELQHRLVTLRVEMTRC